ncbi:DUF1614 domain-containing protein [Synechococcus sp. PCC 7336]|uniref:DUF1614 domain-containing protein n=1 Tax=Synechococcus sp. PCC 7336 TaxID=195250 RepID=UPI00034AA493|nr:DUF1614 domain-containing protein [Synechococcus sp. PCC 7336]
MIYLPVSALLFLVLLLSLPFLILGFTFDVVVAAAAKLGFAPEIGLLLLVSIVIGSTINIPLYRAESTVLEPTLEAFQDFWGQQFWGFPLQRVRRTTMVALNVGGGLIPVIIACYQFAQASAASIVLVTAIVTSVSYYAAQIVPGIGIQINPLLAPITAAIAAALLAGGPPVAFAGGVLGTLIGADLLHLKEIQKMSPGVLSIGGAGVFDGIALCGLFALLLS